MKAQSTSGRLRAQEYLATGAVITAAGVMFMAGSMQLTQTSLMYSRWVAVTLAVVGVFLIGTGLGMRGRNAALAAAAPKAKKPAAAKAALKAVSSTKKHSGRKK